MKTREYTKNEEDTAEITHSGKNTTKLRKLRTLYRQKITRTPPKNKKN